MPDHKASLQLLGDNFRQFSRNARWGTCAFCPRDIQGNAYPEYCRYTERKDHNLNVKQLAGAWEFHTKPRNATNTN